MQKTAHKKMTKEQIKALIEEATVDCYGEDEEFSGIFCMVEESVAVPFTAKVIGETVDVMELVQAKSGFSIQAVCKRNGSNKKYHIDISSLEWTSPFPKGFEWIEAYLEWYSCL